MPNPQREYEEARRLMVRGVAAVKANDVNEARRYLEWVLRIPATSDQRADAHYWLSMISDDQKEKRGHLALSLGYNSAHHRARKQLAILDGKIDPDEIIDPDRYQQPHTETPQKAEGKRFFCQNCGGRMTYSPDGESLTCEYCERPKFNDSEAQLHETDFVIGISTVLGRNKALATLSFECKACGAIYILPPETLSLTCPHCDSAYTIMESETRELIPPEGIIPFKFDAAQAIKLARAWVRKTRPTEKVFHIPMFTGVYLPAWTFDVTGFVRWQGRIYEEDNFLEVSGKETITYDDIFVPASGSPPVFFTDLLAQFKASDVLAYNPEYTVNWLAETYKVAMSDAALEARLIAFNDAKDKLSRKNDLRRISNLKFASDEIVISSFKLVLVPVWIGHANLDGQMIRLTINGMTGTVFGPKPPGKLKQLFNWLIG